jgi:hypothetical protein
MDIYSRGEEIDGVALEPETAPMLFTVTRIRSLLQSRIEDVLNFDSLLVGVKQTKSEIVFHL